MNILTEYDLIRFWGKVDKERSNVFYNGTRCWEWTAGREGDGYGSFRLDGKQHKAHRISWILNFVEIPQGMGVLHHCDNPPCVNPEHLFLGTHKDNMQDKAMKGRNKKYRPLTPPKPRKYRYKLTDEQVIEIRRRYAAWGRGGENCRQLAKEFGVSKSIIHAIATHKRRNLI